MIRPEIQDKSDERLHVSIIKFQSSIYFPETKNILDVADL